MNVIRRLDNLLARIETGMILLCFWLLLAVVLFTILSRNIFHLPSHATFELGPRLVLWLALFGATLALRRGRHIRLELVLRHLGRRVRRWAARIVNLFGALAMGTLLVASLDFVGNEIAMFGGWGRLAAVFPIFFFLAALRYLINLASCDDYLSAGAADREGRAPQ